MKLSARQVFSAYEVLLKAMREQRDDRYHLPTKAAYRVARLVTLLEPEYLALQRTRLEIVKRLGAEDPAAPGSWSVKPENGAAFMAEWGAVIEEQVEVRCEAIPLAQLGDGPSYFTVAELLLLGDLVSDGPQLRAVT